MPLPPYWYNVEPAIYMQAARHNSSIVGALAGAGADNVQVQTMHNVFHFIFVLALKS